MNGSFSTVLVLYVHVNEMELHPHNLSECHRILLYTENIMVIARKLYGNIGLKYITHLQLRIRSKVVYAMLN